MLNHLSPNEIVADKDLIFTLEHIETFRDQDERLYGVVADANKKSIVEIPGKSLIRWIRRLFLYNQKKIMTSAEVDKISNCIEALCEADSVPQQAYFTRIGQRNKVLYYDLGTNSRQVVRVTHKGVKIVDNSNFFIKFKNSMPQAMPDLKTPPKQLLELLQPFFRVDSHEQLILLTVYICTCFIYTINHPILLLHGSKGSSKSTTIEIIARIIDPHSHNRLTLNPERRSLVSTLCNRYFLGFDNLRRLKGWQSDLLCNASTGGAEPMRTLYTNSDVCEVNIKGCVCLNGIDVVATEPDLLDRAIIIGLSPISERAYQTEEFIYSQLRDAMPKILGSIFNGLSDALKLYKTVENFPHARMQDFAKYGYCIAEAIGGYGDVFASEYQGNRRKASLEAKRPLLLECLCAFMRTQGEWHGTMSELYSLLQPVAIKQGYHKYDFPASPTALSRDINGITGMLADEGITICHKKGKIRTLYITNSNFEPVTINT